jgi:hypothetical protein
MRNSDEFMVGYIFGLRLRRVRYEFHRELFRLLEMKDLEEHFAAIWRICEPHMEEDPHEATARGMSPQDLADVLDDPQRVHGLLEALWEMLVEEAREDRERGRTLLAARLREVAEVIDQEMRP